MLAIRARHAFDGTAYRPQGATVLVAEGRIVGVESVGYDVPSDAEVLDFGEATVLPGLVDTHVHLVGDSRTGALDRVAGYREDEIDDVVTRALEQQRASGVTTVRDLGDRDFAVVRRRDSPGVTDEATPHIVAAGPPITIAGGHCASFGTSVDDPAAIRRAVRDRVGRGVDVVKVMASGGVTTRGTDLFAPQFTLSRLRLIVDTAHAAGLPVVVHAHAAAAVAMAVEVGADGIEHLSYLRRPADDVPAAVAALTSFAASDADLARLADSRIAVCPTLGDLRRATTDALGTDVRRDLAAAGVSLAQAVEQRRALLRRAHRAGVRLVGGMDAGISPMRAHGSYAESVLDLSDVMPALDALVASTAGAAAALGLQDRKGRLERGFDADLLVVGGDLAADLTQVRDVRQVWACGVAGDETGSIARLGA